MVSKTMDKFSETLSDIKALLAELVYVVNVLGYIAYTFVIGAYSYWDPKSNADMLFGGITVVCGIVGTLCGGFILDHINATISNAFKLLSGATFLGAIFCFLAFCLKSFYGFIALFAVGEILIFSAQAPVNYVSLHCVKPSLRALSMAMSTVSVHAFGDLPTSPFLGVLQDHIKNWRKTTLILTAIFFLAAIAWFTGFFMDSGDKFNKDSENKLAAKSVTKPLLEESRNDLSEE